MRSEHSIHINNPADKLRLALQGPHPCGRHTNERGQAEEEGQDVRSLSKKRQNVQPSFWILLALSTTLNYQQSALNYLQQERPGKTQINEIHR